MVCKNCGKDVPESADYCEACGAPIQEPIVLKVTREDIKKAGKAEKNRIKEQTKDASDPKKWMDVSGYVKAVGSDKTMLMALIGALLLYIAPFLNWIWEGRFDSKKKANLFEMSLKPTMVDDNGNIFAIGLKLATVLAVVILVLGIIMLALSAADYIRPLHKYAANPIIRFVPIVLLIIVFIVLMQNKTYKQALTVIEDTIKLAKQIGAKSNYDGGKGIGPLIYVLGLLIYTYGTICNLLQRKKQDVEHE